MTQDEGPSLNGPLSGLEATSDMDSNATSKQECSLRLKFAIQLLEQDARPSFIVDLAAYDQNEAARLPILYSNPAISLRLDLRQVLLERDIKSVKPADYLAFRRWVTRPERLSAPDSRVTTYLFHGIVWTTVSLDDQLLVSGLPQTHLLESSSDQLDLSEGQDRVIDEVPQVAASVSVAQDTDTETYIPGPRPEFTSRNSSSHTQLLHDTDWASTGLGASNTWSNELHLMYAFVMADSEPAIFYWSEQLLCIHNAAAAGFFPQVAHSLMGRTLELIFPQAWPAFAPIFAKVQNEMQVVEVEDVPIILQRDGQLKETFVSYRFLPLQNQIGKFLGIYQTFVDVSKENLSRRRLATLLEVSTCSTQVVERKVFWGRLLHALSSNKEDVGFALLYSLDTPPSADIRLINTSQTKSCFLEGVLGLPEGHISAKEQLNLDHDTTGYVPGLRRALEDDAPVLLRVEDGTLTSDYVTDVKCRAYSSPCEAAVVCPIRPTGGTTVVGFLIMGLSSRVTYDDEFRQFIDILNRQIATSTAAVTLFEEELSRERRRVEEAALVHAKLQERLEQKTRALLTSEAKFERMTDFAPIGISMTDPSGKITYANDAWYKITGHAGTEVSAESWMALLHEDDVELAVKSFGELMSTKEDKAFEIRLKKEWVKEIDDVETIRMPTWVLASAYIVDEDENGQGLSLFGALTDISAQKWAEETHRRKMVEALELKAQQESFIDTISHEMRNPLSAVLQSVDEIAEYLSQAPANTVADQESRQSSIEAVDTIMLCCQHQRRVIDDVLTLSKMNTDMLLIAPDDTDPLQVVNNVIRIFSGDARKQAISIDLVVEKTVGQMGVTRLLFDPSRLSQVLVNLLGNAIKFTRDASDRQITVFVGTSATRPMSGDHGVDYVEPQLSKDGNVTSDATDSNGQVYLRIVVQDTGIGMKDEEKQRLFKRFAQASPRTHVRYGGSGLGLFISKKLSELQGGAIGLKMGSHTGTTFAFYISTRRSRIQETVQNLVTETEAGKDVLDGISTESHTQSLPASLSPRFSIADHAVLVVEDNVVNQKVMCQQLRKKGCVVYAASHGVEALDFLEETALWEDQKATGKPLSMILLDIEMPVMDGLTCVRRIRQLEAEGVLNAHVPVISVSANARREQIEQAKLAGMDDNISKPFRIKDLIPIMESLLHQTESVTSGSM